MDHQQQQQQYSSSITTADQQQQQQQQVIRSNRQIPSSIRRRHVNTTTNNNNPNAQIVTPLTPPLNAQQSQQQSHQQRNNPTTLTATSVSPPPQQQSQPSQPQQPQRPAKSLPPPRLTKERLQATKNTFNQILSELMNYLCELTENHPTIKETLTNITWARGLGGFTDHLPYQRLHKQVGPYRNIILKLNGIPLDKRTEMIQNFCQVWPAIVILIDTFSHELANYQSVINKMTSMTLEDRVSAINHIWPKMILLCDFSYMLSEPAAYQYELDVQYALQVCRARSIQPTKPIVESIIQQIPDLLKSIASR